MDVLRDRVRRVAPPLVVTNEVCHGDDGLFAVRREIDAESTQLSEVCVVRGIGARGRRET